MTKHNTTKINDKTTKTLIKMKTERIHILLFKIKTIVYQ